MAANDRWFYPAEMADDLQLPGLPRDEVIEMLACTWEYSRCVVPEFTNWERYIALARLGVTTVLAELRGELVDLTADDTLVAGYDLDELLDTLFGGTAVHDQMSRELRMSVLFSAEKASGRRSSLLFRHFVDALARSPEDYLRLRACDALIRFYLAGAIACNDSEDWLTEDQWELMAELTTIRYDIVSFYKHRAEGEICNTFAYADPALRSEAYRTYREALWALEEAWCHTVAGRAVLNVARYMGGPIHMMMRRYRFVEDGAMIGKPETAEVIDETRRNVKLWYRNEVNDRPPPARDERYQAVMDQADRLLIAGAADQLRRSDEDKCPHCRYRLSYGAEGMGTFGGVELCAGCRKVWGEHLLSIGERAAAVLPLAPAMG